MSRPTYEASTDAGFSLPGTSRRLPVIHSNQLDELSLMRTTDQSVLSDRTITKAKQASLVTAFAQTYQKQSPFSKRHHSLASPTEVTHCRPTIEDPYCKTQTFWQKQAITDLLDRTAKSPPAAPAPRDPYDCPEYNNSGRIPGAMFLSS